jgi:hypothetical protein
VIGRVVGAPSKGEVFTSGQTCWDGDKWYGWLLYIGWYVGALNRVARKLLRLSDFIRKTLKY